METPKFTLQDRYTSLWKSFLIIIWWIGIWGTADTIIHLVFKGQTFMELGVYLFMIAFVLAVIFVHPTFVHSL